MKILIIDDDEALLTVYSTAFKKEGFETVLAINGQEGLERAKETGINLILLDQVLPDISGNEILKTLKETPETKEIPVIILSNFSQEELVKQAIDEGAVDYVFKYQVELSDIVKKVKDALEGTNPDLIGTKEENSPS